MTAYFFWDIENVSIHNLERVMDHVRAVQGPALCYVVYAKIKSARKNQLLENGWLLVETGVIAKNSADEKNKTHD